jgi:PAS domain S-box-containing protein
MYRVEIICGPIPLSSPPDLAHSSNAWVTSVLLLIFYDGYMLEAELFAFLENTADASFAVGESDEICFWNHAAEAIFGYPAKEVLGKTCSAVLHGIGVLGTDVSHERCTALQRHKEVTLIPNFDLNVTTRSGERVWVNISPISYASRRTGKILLVHLARDISAQKKREEVFRRLTAIAKEVSDLEDTITGAAPVNPLSSQELEILRMFAVGTSAPRIAKKLGISPQTLRNHLHHINQKLRTHNRLEAVMHAIQRHLIIAMNSRPCSPMGTWQSSTPHSLAIRRTRSTYKTA